MERSINELILTKQAHLDAIKALDAEIVEKAESQRREMEEVLSAINGASRPRRVDRRGSHRRTPEEIAKMSEAKRAWWAAKKANAQPSEAVA